MSAPALSLLHDPQLRERAAAIALLVCDVDGVLTDGKLYLNDRGEEMKAFCTLDGHGMKLLRASGVELAIITGRSSPTVALRAHELGVAHVAQGASDKLATWQSLLQRLGIEARRCAYVGDDLPDLPVMRRCGLGVAVPSAPEIVRDHAHYVTHAHAGGGAVREVCELIMDAQGTLAQQLETFLR